MKLTEELKKRVKDYYSSMSEEELSRRWIKFIGEQNSQECADQTLEDDSNSINQQIERLINRVDLLLSHFEYEEKKKEEEIRDRFDAIKRSVSFNNWAARFTLYNGKTNKEAWELSGMSEFRGEYDGLDGNEKVR